MKLTQIKGIRNNSIVGFQLLTFFCLFSLAKIKPPHTPPQIIKIIIGTMRSNITIPAITHTERKL